MKNNEKTITLWEILQKIEITKEKDIEFFIAGFNDYCLLESKIKDNPIDIKKAALPDTKETWQEIASMLASLIVLDCKKKRGKKCVL